MQTSNNENDWSPNWPKLLLTCGWFMNPEIWLAESIFIHAKPKIYNPRFTSAESFFESISKSSQFINSYLKYNWLKNAVIWLTLSIFDLIQLKIYKPSFMFLESISTCQKSNSFIHSFLIYSQLRNLAI